MTGEHVRRDRDVQIFIEDRRETREETKKLTEKTKRDSAEIGDFRAEAAAIRSLGWDALF